MQKSIKTSVMLFFLSELIWVSVLVPVHERLFVMVVLFEANKLLFHENASSVGNVVSWNFINVLSSIPLVPSF